MLCASYAFDPLTLTWKSLARTSASRIVAAKFDRLAFVQALCDCRGLSCLPPERFFPDLVCRCAAAGVAVVLVPELKYLKASCAHGWLTPRTAYLATTLRYRRDDHFWFSLYHAGAHLVLKDEGGRMKDETSQQEGASTCNDASRLAADLLIPPQAAGALETLITTQQVQTFALSLGIAAGIVVGQMQFRKFIPYSQFNELKRKLDFTAALAAQEAACSTWPSVSDAAAMILKDLPHLSYAQAKARVSTAVTRGLIPGNGQRWQARRIEPDSLAAWRLDQRDRDLDRADQEQEDGPPLRRSA